MRMFKKLLLTLGLITGLTIGGLAQTSLTYLPIPSDYLDSLYLIKKGGQYLPGGQLAWGWLKVWDGVNINFIKVHTRLTTLEAGGGGGVTDHGALTGLGDDDHTIYYNLARLTTWTGSSNIVTLGTVGTGVWQATAVANGYIASALTGKTYNGVTLNAAGSSSSYLNEAGGYTVPPGSSNDSSFVSMNIGTITEFAVGAGTTIEGVAIKDYDVTIPVSTGRFAFGDGDSYFIEAVDDRVTFYAAGAQQMEWDASYTSFYELIRPSVNKGSDIGTSSVKWNDLFIENVLYDPVASASETEGLTYYDSDDNYLKLWDGTAWDTLNIGSTGGGGGSSLWQESGTNLLPLTAGHDILMAENTERLYFGDTNIEIYRSTGDSLIFEDASGGRQTLYDLATHIDTTNLSTRIDSVSNALQDTIPLGDLVRMLEDSILLWAWPLEDSSQFESGVKKYGFKHYGPDTMYVHQTDVLAVASSVNFTYNVHWASDVSGADVDMFTSAVQVSGVDAITTGEIDTPNNHSIPPGVYVYIQFYDLTTKPPDGAWFNFIGYEY